MSVRTHSIYNLVGTIIPIVIALVTIPLYLNLIGTERYGVLAIAWLVLGYFGVLDLGLGPATAQRIAALHESSPEHRARVFWTAGLVNIGVGIIGGILLYFGARYFFQNHFEADPALIAEMLDALPWLAIAVPVATLAGVAKGALQGRNKFLDINVATVIGSSLFQTLPLAVAFAYGPELQGLIFAALLARVLGLLIFFLRVHRHLLDNFWPKFDRKEWLPLLKFGGWVSVTTMVGPMMVAADRMIIGALVGAAAVAIYAVAFDVARRLTMVPYAIGGASFPQFAKGDKTANDLLMNRSLGAMALIMTAPVIVIVFFAEPLLALWLGEELGLETSKVAKILLIAYWGNAFAITPFIRIQGEGRPNIATITTVAQAPFLIAGIYFATRYYGIVGAALVVAARCNIEVLILLFLANRKAKLPWYFLAGLALLAIAYLVSERMPLLSFWGIATILLLSPTAYAVSWLLVPAESREDFRILIAKVMQLPLIRRFLT